MASSSLLASGKLKPKPLMLKDFLRDDPSSESFRATPGRPQETTVRYLLEAEFKKSRCNDARERLLLKGRSKNPLTKISAVLNAVRILPFISSTSSSSSSPNATHSKQGIIPRSFSRRLFRRSFWTKRAIGRAEQCSFQNATTTIKGRMLIRDIVRLGSSTDDTRGGKPINLLVDLSIPTSPVAVSSGRNSCSCSSSSSGWSENGSLSSGSDSLPSPSSPVSSELTKPESKSPEKRKTTMTRMVANPISSTGLPPDGLTRGVGGDCTSTATASCRRGPKQDDGTETMECTCNRYEDDNDQFSPVSVLDFPYEEEGEEEGPESAAASPPYSFHQILAKLEDARNNLLHEIRRFETVADLVVPLDLHDSSSAAETDPEQEEHVDDDLDEEEDEQLALVARELLEQIKSRGGTKWSGDDDDDVVLLLDFFIEGLRDESTRRAPTWRMEMGRRQDRTVEEGLLAAAWDWIQETETVATDGAALGGIGLQIKEMEGDGRWRCFHAEEDEIAADVESRVFGSLVEELLHDLP